MQRPILKLSSRLVDHHRFETRVKRLLKSVARRTSSHEITVGEWSRSRLAKTIKRFFRAIPANTKDPEALHRFRVRGKELRYALELFASLYPTDVRGRVYPLVTELQDRLGKLNDHATACQHLGKWSKQTDHQRNAKYLRRLRAKRGRKQLERATEEFRRWWTPNLACQLEASLRELTDKRNLTGNPISSPNA